MRLHGPTCLGRCLTYHVGPSLLADFPEVGILTVNILNVRPEFARLTGILALGDNHRRSAVTHSSSGEFPPSDPALLFQSSSTKATRPIPGSTCNNALRLLPAPTVSWKGWHCEETQSLENVPQRLCTLCRDDDRGVCTNDLDFGEFQRNRRLSAQFGSRPEH